jgi:hypothetical protein
MVEGDTFEEPGWTAIDNVDGDITHLVIVSGNANTALAGVYTLTYTVSDRAGNTGSGYPVPGYYTERL